MIYRILRLPLPYTQKANIIRTKGLSKALYGIEATKIQEALQVALTTAIKNPTSTKCNHKDLYVTFSTASYGHDLDPEVCIFGAA